MYSPDPRLAAAAKASMAPPAGSPHAIPLPGSQKPGYSAVYRHWKVGTGPLVASIDPQVSVVFLAHAAPRALSRALCGVGDGGMVITNVPAWATRSIPCLKRSSLHVRSKLYRVLGRSYLRALAERSQLPKQ
jgi:hypothetical protein